MSNLSLQDLAPPKQQFLDDVLKGLQSPHKALPCKYFYDERGSQLFEQICELDEYYLTRTELHIMCTRAGEMAAPWGDNCMLVEYGSGSGQKTKVLLDHMDHPAAYVPVDISREHLRQTAAELDQRYPGLLVMPVCADFTRSFDLPIIDAGRRTVVYFPGSTIGNFGPAETVQLLRNMADVAGDAGGLLIGVDLKKSRDILEAAYNDRTGVTAEFNLNLLARINRELGADFSLERFRHHAFFNADDSRIEVHLVSEADQKVRIGGAEISFHRGETIHTENSYKYSLAQFRRLAEDAGLQVERLWTDENDLFSVQHLTVRPR